VLRHLPPQSHPDLLSGTGLGDDAAVFRVREDLALVQTVDFFTPVVDDPYTFGLIAAANSLSDVYALGATPLTALNIVGFPIKSLPADLLTEILRGGADKIREAGAVLVGGHTIDDEEPKYGLAVTGTVHPEHFVRQDGARPGDVLILTKPVGTGLVTTALKAGAAHAADVRQAVRWMTQLNRDASEQMIAADADAATDITGYGLLGHLLEQCRAAALGARIHVDRVPLLPGALDYARAGYSPSGTWTNWDAIRASVRPTTLAHETQAVLADPQTSGGLLIAVSPGRIDDFVASDSPGMLAAIIGEMTADHPGAIEVVE
jgi:selenide,water dikinase